MYKNYFQIAIRNFKNNKLFSFVNIAGLAIGLACLLAFVIALSTVVFQAFKAANSNPVNSLRYE